MDHDYAFEMSTSSIRFGVGVTREVGMDLADLGARRVLVVADPKLARLAPVEGKAREHDAHPAVRRRHLG